MENTSEERLITLFKIVRYWLEHDETRGKSFPQTKLYGYFPTPEEGRAYAQRMKLGEEIVEPGHLLPHRQPTSGDRFGRAPIPSVGYEIQPIDVFSTDEGKTGYLKEGTAKQLINFEGGRISTPVEDVWSLYPAA